MFFEYKKPLPFSYGDHRVIRKFALFPHRVDDAHYKAIGVVWLEQYEIVQKFYTAINNWDSQSNHRLGTGVEVAKYRANLYGGRFIQ